MYNFLIYGLSNGFGGVESIVLNMCREMSRLHSFDLLLSEGECSYCHIFDNKNINRINVSPWGKSRKTFREDLKRVLTSKKYDYVWFNGCIMSNVDLWDITKRYSTAKTIAHSHGSSFEENNKIKRFVLLTLHYLNRRRFKKLTDIPCMCSRRSGDWFYGSSYCDDHKVYMINNGIDADKFKFDEDTRSSYRNDLGLVADEFVLFHAGRLTHVKNQSFIIDILCELLHMGVKARFALAGSGELDSELKEYAKSKGVYESILFLGSRSDVAQLYQAADCFILPSFHEGFPVTMIEAQTAGLPCFVSHGVTREVDVTGDVHFMDIHSQTPQEWAKEIAKTATEVVDRRKGYDKVVQNRFTVPTVCDDFIQHIEKYAL